MATAIAPILFLPTWSIVHSRCWKAQIPYLARRHRVIVFDPRGNGSSGRPVDPAAYAEAAFADDALAVLDATGTDRAVVVGLSLGAQRGLILATRHPDRVAGMVLIGPAVALAPFPPERARAFERFHDERDDARAVGTSTTPTTGGATSRTSWSSSSLRSSPSRTRRSRSRTAWGGGSSAGSDCLLASEDGAGLGDAAAETAAAIRCPVLVIHGDDDAIAPHAAGRRARAPDRRIARHDRGRRPLPAGPRPGAREPAHPRLRRVARRLEDRVRRPPPSRRAPAIPDADGFVERDGVRVHWERYGARDRPPSCSFRRGRSCTRAAGSARSRTWPGTARWSRSTRAGTAAPTGPGPRRSTPGANTPPTPSRCSTPSASAVRWSWRGAISASR